MRATVSRTEFAAALSAVAPAFPNRPTHPVLAAVRLEVTDDTMTVYATDYYLTMQRNLNVQGDTDGLVLVSGHRLRDLVAMLPGNTVDLQVEGGRLEIAAGRSKHSILTFPPGEYPATPKVPSAVGATTTATVDLTTRAVAHAVLRDASASPELFGVWLEVKDGQLWFVTTDRFRIACVPTPWVGEHFTARLQLDHLQAVAKNLTGDIAVHVDADRVAFVTDKAMVMASNLGGEYVKWAAFYDGPATATHRVDVGFLTDAVERAALAADRDAALTITATSEDLTITSRDETSDAHEAIECAGDGDFRFGANPSFLLALLKSVREPEAIIRTSGPGKPIRIRGLIDDEPTDAAHVLMPVRLNRN